MVRPPTIVSDAGSHPVPNPAQQRSSASLDRSHAEPNGGSDLNEESVEFHVVSRTNGRPVGGVRVQVSHVDTSRSGITDDTGCCVLRYPAGPGRFFINATPESGFILGMPRVLTSPDPVVKLVHVAQLEVVGQVRMHTGEPVPDARIYLVALEGVMEVEPWPVAREVAVTDSAGLYRFLLKDQLPYGASVLAAARGFIPAHSRLDDGVGQVWHRDLVLPEGDSWEVRVLNEAGGVVPGCRLRVMTHVSVFSGRAADDVPVGAGGEIGLVSLEVKTDQRGEARVLGWPKGATARVRLFPTKDEELAVVSVSSGTLSGQRVFTVDTSPGLITIVVSPKPIAYIAASGRCVGFSRDDLAGLRIIRSAGSERLQAIAANPGPDGVFSVNFPVGSNEQMDRLVVSLSAEIPAQAWSRDIGQFILVGDRRIDGLLVSK